MRADFVPPPRESLAEAQRLIDDGRPFHAHEVLEASWKAAPTSEKPFWRALAQLAVGLTHAQRGNLVGASALLTRGAAGLAHAAEIGTAQAPGSAGNFPSYDVPVARLCADAHRLAALAAEGRSFSPTLRLID